MLLFFRQLLFGPQKETLFAMTQNHTLFFRAQLETVFRIHAHRFLCPAFAHFEHTSMFQITQNSIVDMPFAPRKFIDAEKPWRSQRNGFIFSASLSSELFFQNHLKAGLDKT
ncbi:hypothetical protein KDK_69550 [Dictyobacter kobayashii]|uniref:Uncharacterized protein n=1 Tax=Dictyobacter kobayashii TaxID=2014872 RepID=A0A402AVR9_9CHLR|nr:hypothetical protein KDK_69550 [Dictyobacter kobayashii]